MRVTLNETKIIKRLEKQRALHGVPARDVKGSRLFDKFTRMRKMNRGRYYG